MSVYLSTSDEVVTQRVAKNVTNEAGMLNDLFQSLRTGENLTFAVKVPRAERRPDTAHLIVKVNGQDVRRYYSGLKSGRVMGVMVHDGSFVVFIGDREISMHDLAFTVRMVNPDKVTRGRAEITDED